MSLPAELRLLCHQLSSTPNSQLPNSVPSLLRMVLRCRAPLSSGQNPGSKADTSESSVLVHKLKTQISTLLYGKTMEGRFAAVVLIKAIAAAGEWETLRGVESWVRGLVSILGKQDPIATKRLCIFSLTSIYLMTYQYQSLVREITTPTLPSFVSSCMSLSSPKLSPRAEEVSCPLLESIFESFCVLIPRYPTIFRPYSNQIRVVVRPYLAPTLCDRHFVPSSLSQSARHVVVILYQTASKNMSGEEWGKGVRALVRDIHVTIDQVYRAVQEDWESTEGYVSKNVDINQEMGGGAKSQDDLPAWNGIDAGVQRLEGMLELLKEYFIHQTATAVNIPIDLIVDLLTRLASVVPPTNIKGVSESDGLRLHPAIERSERDGLWAGLGKIHLLTVEVFLVLADRLQDTFMSVALRCLFQMTWIFSSHTHDEAFRSVFYRLIAKVLRLCGISLDQSTVNLLTPVIQACCKEFPMPGVESRSGVHEDGKVPTNGPSINADSFLNSKTTTVTGSVTVVSKALDAARELLPIFLSHLPQPYLQGYLRSKIDQTGIVTHNKTAMLASVLNPYLRKNGTTLPSILPHLCREFSDDAMVEALLRPRLPVLQQSQATYQVNDLTEELSPMSDDLMEDVTAPKEVIGANEVEHTDMQNTSTNEDRVTDGRNQLAKLRPTLSTDNPWGGPSHVEDVKLEPFIGESTSSFVQPFLAPIGPENANLSHPVAAIEEEEEDTDESVHLNMDLSESEDESIS